MPSEWVRIYIKGVTTGMAASALFIALAAMLLK